MSNVINFLLTLVLIYGYPLIGLIVLSGSFALPLPITTILVAAGSFTVGADSSLNIYILIGIVTVTAIIGDIFGYFLGTKVGAYSHIKLARSDAFLKRWGIWCIFLTRWLITPLGVPVNIVAGINKYSFRKFISAVIFGEFLWASIYLLLGRYFGASWVSIVEYIDNAPEIIALAVIGLILLYFALTLRNKHK